MAANQVYQYSVIAALMTGLASASSSTTLSHLLTHGDQGLGTFEHMDGEMIILDSQAYQLKADGSIASVPDDAKIPFAAITQFEAQMTKSVVIADKDALLYTISEMLPKARNHFVSVKVEGKFSSVKARTVPPQKYPGELLVEAGKRQVVKEYHDVTGTIVGFRSPQWSDGVSVAGIHIHFLDEKREFGGHVLGVSAEKEVKLAVSLCTDLQIELPQGDEFGARDLEQDAEGLKKVEG